MEAQGVEYISPEQQKRYKPTTQLTLATHVLHHFTDIDGSGDLYKGEFVVVTRFNGRFTIRHGLGTIQYANGSVYEGMWNKGLREGYGRLIHPTGDMYEGDWSGDKANGRGIFSNVEGYTYQGDWVDDCQHGIGCERWQSNASCYEGRF